MNQRLSEKQRKCSQNLFLLKTRKKKEKKKKNRPGASAQIPEESFQYVTFAKSQVPSEWVEMSPQRQSAPRAPLSRTRGPAPFPVSTGHVDPAFGLGKKGHPAGRRALQKGSKLSKVKDKKGWNWGGWVEEGLEDQRCLPGALVTTW